MFAILCVLDDPQYLHAVLDAWRGAGVGGITILESTGLHRLRNHSRIPMRYAFGEASTEQGNLTLFAVVEQEAVIQTCLAATERVVGDFNRPNTGVFVSWPLGLTKGISGKQAWNQERME